MSPLTMLVPFVVCLVFGLAGCHRTGSKPSDQEQQAYQCFEQAMQLNCNGQFDSAQALIRRGLAFTDVTDSTRGFLYAEWCASYVQQGKLAEALQKGRQAMALCRGQIAPADFAVICGNVGIAYRRQGMNDSAAVCYEVGINEAMKADTTDVDAQDAIAYLCNNMTVLYCDNKRYEESLALSHRAQQAARRAADSIELFSAIANEGITLCRMQRYHEARPMLIHAWQEATAMGHAQLQLKVVSNLLYTTRAMNDVKATEQYLAQAKPLLKLVPPYSIQAQGIHEAEMNVLADKGQYAQALAIAQGFDTLDKQKTVVLPYHLHRFKARCHAALNQYREAWHEEALATQQQDSIASNEVHQQLSELSVKLQTREKQLEITRLQRRSAQRTAVSAIVVALLSLTIVLLWVRRRQLKRQMAMARSKCYIDGLEAERIRLGRELHDGICNDLLALGMRLRSGDVSEAQAIDQLGTLRNEVRRISHEMMPPKFDLVTLNDVLADYTRHMADLIPITYHAEGAGWQHINPHHAYQLYRIVQEALSNVLTHTTATHAAVTLVHRGAHTQLTIYNEGTLLGGASQGRGLDSMRQRAESIGAQLVAGASGKGYSVSVTLHQPA